MAQDLAQYASIHTEVAVLGAMLIEPETAVNGIYELGEDDFSLESHRRIFRALVDMASDGVAIDLITVGNELEDRRELESIGRRDYLRYLTEGVPHKLNIDSYVTILREKTRLRNLANLIEATATQVAGGAEASEVLDSLSLAVHEAQSTGLKLRPKSIAEFALEALDELTAQRKHTGEVLGISTGLPTLDKVTTGFREGELTYVGASPGRGKTSFMLQAIYDAAKKGIPVGCISLEMRGRQLVRRLAVMETRLFARKLRDPRLLNDSEWNLTKHGVNTISELPIEMCDVPGLRPSQIASLARQMHKSGAKIIFVDFVQIIHEDGRDRREAINRVSASLRDTCKFLEIPFVVASQLARADKRDVNHRPTIADLRESGNLEQDAHNVLLLYRPKEVSSGEWTGEDEIIVDKQREGVTGPVPVRYNGNLLQFEERA